ncbi:hypothetical protein [Amycolatopsis sp. NPDC049159]|uniref:hypothetical protein n=1 Tax=Amycolatopsis sp. NPDC049159 TaxID=3157210 RepID=UPI00340CE8AE
MEHWTGALPPAQAAELPITGRIATELAGLDEPGGPAGQLKTPPTTTPSDAALRAAKEHWTGALPPARGRRTPDHRPHRHRARRTRRARRARRPGGPAGQLKTPPTTTPSDGGLRAAKEHWTTALPPAQAAEFPITGRIATELAGLAGLDEPNAPAGPPVS